MIRRERGTIPIETFMNLYFKEEKVLSSVLKMIILEEIGCKICLE